MIYGLKEKTIEKIISVFAHFNELEEVILYGSRAMGNYKPGSDIDLALKGSLLNGSKVNRISLKLDELLLPYAFDLSILSQISNNDLISHIESIGISFYKR
jgi:predicted nucleotidyltransferase